MAPILAGPTVVHKEPISLEGNAFSVPTSDTVDEKIVDAHVIPKNSILDEKVHTGSEGERSDKSDSDNKDAIVITGSDAATYLLPLRDDHDAALTFRSLVLASGLSCFQAVLTQIYTVLEPRTNM